MHCSVIWFNVALPSVAIGILIFSLALSFQNVLKRQGGMHLMNCCALKDQWNNLTINVNAHCHYATFVSIISLSRFFPRHKFHIVIGWKKCMRLQNPRFIVDSSSSVSLMTIVPNSESTNVFASLFIITVPLSLRTIVSAQNMPTELSNMLCKHVNPKNNEHYF